MTAPDLAEASRDTVFVFGALRSGTTLFRLMLDMHENLHNPGEADFLFDHIRRQPDGSWRYDYDRLRIDRIFQNHKLEIDPELDGTVALAGFLNQWRARRPGQVLTLNIHRHAALAAELTPDARILHILRDPRDVARSSIHMGWGGSLYFAVDHWIETEEGWDAAARAWPADRVHELRYEDLVEDATASLDAVCGFLGVPYSARMLDFHETSRYAPVDPKLAYQWKRKCTDDEVRMVESKMLDLMRRRGYAPAHPDARPPSLPARLAMLAGNKAHKYRHAIERHGVRLVLAEKATRRLGMKEAHRRIQNQINENIRQRLS